MEAGRQGFAEGIENAPPEIRECLTQAFGDLENITPSPQNGEKMKECFEKFGGPGEGPAGAEMRTGPGGCQSREECEAYCRSNPEACGFGPREGREGERPMMPPPGEEMGPRPEMGNPGMEDIRSEMENNMMEFREEGTEPTEEFNSVPDSPEPNESPSGGSEEPVSLQTPGRFFLNLLANILLAR
ncbi:hypothetical protein HYW73_00905 [Candidatus Nomurabacteria bacterium]|nr:hypothetical protein [Candidatus Nomurabacteria bacterium]